MGGGLILVLPRAADNNLAHASLASTLLLEIRGLLYPRLKFDTIAIKKTLLVLLRFLETHSAELGGKSVHQGQLDDDDS
jgi:hypothetical protein